MVTLSEFWFFLQTVSDTLNKIQSTIRNVASVLTDLSPLIMFGLVAALCVRWYFKAIRFAKATKKAEPVFAEVIECEEKESRKHGKYYNITYKFMFDGAERTCRECWLDDPIEVGHTVNDKLAMKVGKHYVLITSVDVWYGKIEKPTVLLLLAAFFMALGVIVYTFS